MHACTHVIELHVYTTLHSVAFGVFNYPGLLLNTMFEFTCLDARIGGFELSQLSCLSSSVGRASRLKYNMSVGLSPTGMQPFVVSGLVYCCVALCCLSFFLS